MCLCCWCFDECIVLHFSLRKSRARKSCLHWTLLLEVLQVIPPSAFRLNSSAMLSALKVAVVEAYSSPTTLTKSHTYTHTHTHTHTHTQTQTQTQLQNEQK